MHEAEKLNLDQIRGFVGASEGIRFEGKPESKEKALVVYPPLGTISAASKQRVEAAVKTGLGLTLIYGLTSRLT